ncbi:MAG: hypothetical protein HKN70_09665 [Gammaproteobacteria bacterium]|nr:hypothetical protein [Gammaproteobacteria bacterium]
MSHLIDLAKMADDVYLDANESRLHGNWAIKDALNVENLRIRAYEGTRSKTLVLCIRGTANTQDLVVSDLAGIGLGGGVLGLKMNDAVAFTSDYARSSKDVWLTGHSLGGAYVQILSCILNVPGVTFNAPGVVSMINQMDGHPVIAALGGIAGAGMGVLASIASPLFGKDIVDFITKSAAGASNNAFGTVANYRGNLDPVSKVGVHVGTPPITINLASQKPHPHSMVPLIAALENRKK